VPAGWAWPGDATISGRKLARERAFVNMMDNADQHGQGLIGITIQRQCSSALVIVGDAGRRALSAP
jgi:hypothetical protein